MTQIKIKSVKPIDEETVAFVFTVIAESLFVCSGIHVDATAHGVEIRLVRSHIDDADGLMEPLQTCAPSNTKVFLSDGEGSEVQLWPGS